jgi:ribosome-associated protein
MPQLEFRLTGEFIALNNLLKVTGVCASGGAGKALVATGTVRVDGAVELRKTCKIRAGQVVRVGDVQIRVLGNDPAQ